MTGRGFILTSGARVTVIIPVLNEELSIGKVIDAIPRELVDEIICVDNGCTDKSPEIASARGARVVRESKKGYGAACWTGIIHASEPDIVVFLDGDLSDHPEEMPLLITPITNNKADFVIGSRITGNREPDALLPHSVFGNWLAAKMLRLFFGIHCTDLGPFRAIRYDRLMELDMQDRRFGWTMEMQAKAAARRYHMLEIPVSYRKRIGKSKITGNILNSCRAGWMIITTCVKVAIAERFMQRWKTKR